MTGPTRLIDEPGGDQLEASLLRLARSEGPSSEGRRRILAGIAAAGATSLASQTAEAAGGASGKGTSIAKWSLLGVAAIVVPAALWLGGSSDTPHPTKIAPPSALQAPATEVTTPKPLPEADGPAPVSLDDLPTLPNAASGSTTPGTKPQGTLAEEVAQLQKAKLALKAGNAGEALAELQTYAQRFPRPRLGAEALVVRVEALHASGDAARARSLAEGFLAKNPNSPYATRLRNLTGAR
jgi:hypothetical protein